MTSNRQKARELCHEAIRSGDFTGWFERLYADVEGDSASIPWADLEPNPNLTTWLASIQTDLSGLRCLTVGCGLGDDCEFLAQAGAQVTGFDIAPTAIEWCRKRFADSEVSYEVHDLFDMPSRWWGRFDFVVEAYTLQVLPDHLRCFALEHLSSVVKPGGDLLIICRGRSDTDPPGEMPWPLCRIELDVLNDYGMSEVHFEDYGDSEDPPVRRFRALYRRV